MKNKLRKILLVDDDPDLCQVVQIILDNAGYKVRVLDHFEPFDKKNEPDAILLDIALPGQDGGKICRQLKKDKETKHIPVILFSANPDTAKAALESGANDSIVKPFQINELVKKLQNLPIIPQNVEKTSHKTK